MKFISQIFHAFVKNNLLFLLIGSSSAWATIPQLGNLVTHYPFSGNTNDNSGNSHDGTISGNPSLTTDRFGNSNSAYSFDGNGDYIDFGTGMLPLNNGGNTNDPFTISVWAKSSSTATMDLFAYGGMIHCGGGLYGAIVRLGSNIQYNSCNRAFNSSAGGSNSDGNWHQYVFTWDSSVGRRVYKDGALIGSNGSTDVFRIQTNSLVLGKGFMDWGDGTFFNGSADEFRLWKTALTSSEVSTLYTDENSSIPTISSVSSDKVAGSYKTGEVIDIDVAFSTAVTVTGTPQIILETGTTDQVVNYSSGSGGTTLTFNYTVQAGDTAADLDYASTTALALNSGTIQDAAGNNATLTLPTVGGSDSLAGNEALVIDTTSPSISSSATASVAENQTSAITIAASDTNTISYSVSGDDSASFSVNSSSGVVTFDSAPDYETKTYYSFTATATDTAGNTDTQSVTITVTDVDDSAPTLSSSSPSDGSTSFNASNNITLTFNEAVDVESGNIVLYKADGTAIETFNVTSSGLVTGTGSTTITINPTSDLDNSTSYYIQIAVSAFDDSSSNSYAGISDTTTLNFTTSSGDTTAPTMSITATGVSSVADGTTTEDATLTMTFTSSEATSDFAIGDISITNATLSSFSATSSTVYTATLTPTKQGAVTVNVAAGTFNDAAGNANAATNEFNWKYLSSPLNKTDVTASIKVMSGVAIDAVAMNFNAVEHRVSWLNANVGSNKLSHQGVRLNFANPTVNKLMNTAYVKLGKLDLSNEFVKLIRNNIKDGEAPEATAITDDTKQGLSSVGFNEFAKVREDTLDKVLNATGGSVMGDWNIWTEGRITVGKTYKTDVSAEQDSQTQNLSLGFDRIIQDDNNSDLSPNSRGHIVGVVLGIGKSDADTTNNSTVDANSYSLSAYGVIRQDDKALAQAMMGYGHIKVDKTRIDGSDTLNGAHDANQFFTSIKVQKETMSVGSFSLSPYGKIHASRTWYDGYAETGGSTALTYGKQTIDSTVLSVGLDVDYLIPIHKGNIRPFMQYEYGADVSGSSTVNMHYNNEITNYQLELDNKADSNWKFVVGADMYTKDEWDSSISYERTEAVNAGYSDSLAVKVGLKF